MSAKFNRLLMPMLMPFLLSPLAGEIQLGKLFSNGMVLQRGIEVPVWGWSAAGETIRVTFDGKNYSGNADHNGKWMVRLPAMVAGGPYKMHVVGKGGEVLLEDIWVGDVWVCSGQSNMEWQVAISGNAAAEIAAANDPMIRHFKVPRSSAKTPQDTLVGGEWQVASPKTVGGFTAVGYYFARELRKSVDVPIGLLNTSWGGSRLEPWMHANALGITNAENAIDEIREEQEAFARLVRAELEANVGPLPDEDAGMDGDTPLWADPDLDDSNWDKIPAPVLWESDKYQGLDGIGWYRGTFELSEAEAANPVEIGVGQIDDSDITWVNGVEVGRMEMQYNKPRVYQVPVEALRPGINHIAIRVEDTGGGGGIWGEAELMYVKAGNDVRSLAGDWRFKVGAFISYTQIFDNQVPTILYNQMIHPILNFPIKGALWYQGESNAGPADAYQYRELFPKMIRDWRERWNVGEFPFLFVQLANFMAEDDQPAESDWAVLRESQSATLAVPNTAQAVIIDIGDAADIHPRNKQDVGLRLSLAARKLAYGEDVVYSGPVFKSQEIMKQKVALTFDHIGGGLKAKDKYGYLKGFAIAGADKKFVWAKAQIKGDKVYVWNEAVKEPVAVRYAWGNNPEDANLYNAEGLPASPFCTD